ncbi:hypothetical protein TWF173_005511 [Orbilia oligospora]|nr:hypothetical protein TWF173_005511 [Orbilia oligospora]
MASRLLSRSRTANWHRLNLQGYPSHRYYSLKPTTLSSSSNTPKVGIDQDHHYTSTTATTATPPLSQPSDLNIRQVSSKARTLPDGTIPEVTAEDTIPSTVSESPEPDLSTINAEVFHSRRAKALGNTNGGLNPVSSGTPASDSSDINKPEFTNTSPKVQSTASKVMDELKAVDK